jgi:Ca-activated chloride channel family protein
LLLSAQSVRSQPPNDAGSPTFRVRANLIRVPVTVFGPTGKLLTGLEREHFSLLDENRPRVIENFVLDQDRIHVALLLDVSGSVRSELEQIAQAALEFARSFQRNDRISVISFSDQVQVLQDWTPSLGAVRKALKKLEPGYRTALYDALWTTTSRQLSRVRGKKAIILLTDGLDNESGQSYDQIIQSLISNNVALYIIGRTRLIQDEVGRNNRVEFLTRVMSELVGPDEDFVGTYFRQKEAAMMHLAEATGGRALFPERLKELADRYRELARELKSQYVLTFRPPLRSDLTFRSIQVRCVQPTGKILHRRQYYWSGLP